MQRVTTGGPNYIGRTTDLWTPGQPCLDNSLQSQGIRKNDPGDAVAKSDVAAFFQDSIQNGNKYGIWDEGPRTYGFDETKRMACFVQGRGPL